MLGNEEGSLYQGCKERVLGKDKLLHYNYIVIYCDCIVHHNILKMHVGFFFHENVTVAQK